MILKYVFSFYVLLFDQQSKSIIIITLISSILDVGKNFIRRAIFVERSSQNFKNHLYFYFLILKFEICSITNTRNSVRKLEINKKIFNFLFYRRCLNYCDYHCNITIFQWLASSHYISVYLCIFCFFQTMLYQ